MFCTINIVTNNEKFIFSDYFFYKNAHKRMIN